MIPSTHKSIAGSDIKASRRLRLSGESKIFSACFLLSSIFAVVTAYSLYKQSHSSEHELHAEIVLGASSVELLHGRRNFLGEQTAPYTLVEFGDYECPPCRATQQHVKNLMKLHKGSLKLDFRQFPLTMLHRNALAAAQVSEVARINGDFWRTHDDLFVANFARKPLRYMLPASFRSAVNNQLEEDRVLARRLRVNGTPSFFVCLPNDRVYRLSNVDDVNTVISSIDGHQ